ncbi:MAG: M56 family metallopeptidase [Eubacteriales bacterium]
MNIEKIFLLALNMSLTAGYVMLVVLIIRAFMKKSAKWIISILWFTVFLRLILPISFSSDLSFFSVIPESDISSEGVLSSNTPEIHSGLPYLNSMINPTIEKSVQAEAGISIIEIAAVVWIIGFAAIMIYSIISYILLKKRLSTAVLFSYNVFKSDKIASPFVLGFFKPRIYIPCNLSGEPLKNVLLHENAHISRRDYIIKPLIFLISSLHWFNPFIWVAYILLSRDIELACDEKAIKNMGGDERKNYSETLLSLSVNKGNVAVCPIAFGEVNVKKRIKNALSYKKPAFWIIIAAFIVTTAAAAALIANPTIEKDNTISDVSDIYGTYYANEVVYVNPLSSFYPFDLTKAPYYVINKNEFSVFDQETEEAIYSENPLYAISEITEEEFKDLFFMDLDIGMIEISGYSNIREMKISDEYILFIIDSELWIAGMNGEYIWIIYKLGSEKPKADISQIYYRSRLTIDELGEMVEEKGEKLTWDDFEKYECTVTGSGLFILKYPINDELYVLVGGSGTDEKPMYIYLARETGDDESEKGYIELREKGIDIQDFVNNSKNISPQSKNTWTIIPSMSSIFPAFPIIVDIDHSKTSVIADKGSLYINSGNKTECGGKEYTYMQSEIIYWSPLDENTGGDFRDFPSRCILQLEIKDDKGKIISTIEIKITKISEDEASGSVEYEATLTKNFDNPFFYLEYETDCMAFALRWK